MGRNISIYVFLNGISAHSYVLFAVVKRQHIRYAILHSWYFPFLHPIIYYLSSDSSMIQFRFANEINCHAIKWMHMKWRNILIAKNVPRKIAHILYINTLRVCDCLLTKHFTLIKNCFFACRSFKEKDNNLSSRQSLFYQRWKWTCTNSPIVWDLKEAPLICF